MSCKKEPVSNTGTSLWPCKQKRCNVHLKLAARLEAVGAAVSQQLQTHLLHPHSQPGLSVPGPCSALTQVLDQFCVPARPWEQSTPAPLHISSALCLLVCWTSHTEAVTSFRDDEALQVVAHQHLCKSHSQEIEPSCPKPVLKVKWAVILERFLGRSEFHHHTKDMALQEMQLRIYSALTFCCCNCGILPGSYEKK